MKLLRRFTPPTRTAFDKPGQAVIDDIYRILNERNGIGGESRGDQTYRPPVLQVFANIQEARTFFQELNINSLHAVATRTGSLTIDNVLTMSEGAEIFNLDSYNITDDGIVLQAGSGGKGAVLPETTLRWLADITNALSAEAGSVKAYWDSSVPMFDIESGYNSVAGRWDGKVRIFAGETYFYKEVVGLGLTNFLPGDIIAGLVDAQAFTTSGNGGPADFPYGIRVEGDVYFASGMRYNYVTKTANYTATTEDYIIDCTSGTFTVTLYAANFNAGRALMIVNSGSGTITVDADGSETINGDLTKTLLTDDAMSIVCTGSGWRIV